ncbi:MAG TPA: glycosyltransferase [Anaerolineae bacterium]
MAEHPARILQVNAWDVGGGAASVAWNLFTAYRARGYDSWLAVGRKYSSDPGVLQIPPNQEFYGRWSRFWWHVRLRLEQLDGGGSVTAALRRIAFGLAEPKRALDIVRGIEDFNFPGSGHLLALPERRPTVVHAHNLHNGYFDLRSLPSLSREVPLVLTLHDAWLLSGHCAHSFGCTRWQSGCGHCPDLTIPPAIRRDATGYNWQRKREIYQRCQFYVATPSHWLMQKVEQSILAPGMAEARVIANGVDLDVFCPADRRTARASLGLPQDSSILLFTANTIRENVWKDYQTMREAAALAAEWLDNRHVLLVALGEGGPPERIGRAEIRFVPYQATAEVVARYYQAADVYVHAARADTFPNSILEALASGTPVVATAVGGIPEQIEDGDTGFLVPPGDVAELARRLVSLLADDALNRHMAAAAAGAARKRFDFRYQVDAYLAWYYQLLEANDQNRKRMRYAVSSIT